MSRHILRPALRHFIRSLTLVSASAWTPASPTPDDGYSPVLWLESSTGIYQDAAMTTPATSDGDPLGGWQDQSGNNNHFTQANAVNKPSYQSGVADLINGLPVIRFDGTTDYLDAVTNNFLTGSSGAVFAIIRITNLGGDTWFSSSDEAATLSFVYFRAYQSATYDGPRIEKRNGASAATLNSILTQDADVVATTPYLMTYQSSGTAYAIRVNSTNQALTVLNGANNGDWFGDVAGLDNVTIGCQVDTAAGEFFDGDLGEVLVYDGDSLSASDVTTVEEYFTTKWAIAGTFGAFTYSSSIES